MAVTIDINANTAPFIRGMRTAGREVTTFRSRARHGFRQLNHDLRGTEQVFGRLGAAIGQKNRALGDMTGQLGRVNSGLGKLALGSGAVVVALGALGAAGIKAFGEIEKAAFNASRILEGNILKNMRDGIKLAKELTADLGVSLSSGFDALYQARSAGASDPTASARAALEYQAITGTPASSTAAAFTNLAKFGYSPRQAANVLLQAEIQAQATPQEIVAAFGDILPLASTQGVQIPELLALLDALTSTGLKAPRAATQIRSFIEELGDPDRQAGKSFGEIIGATLKEALQTDTLAGLLERLTLGAGGPDATRQLFGSVEAKNAYGVLQANQQEYFDTELALRRKSTTELERQLQAQQQLQTTAQAKLGERLKGYLTDIGERLQPFFTKLLDTLGTLWDSKTLQGLARLAGLLTGGILRGFDLLIKSLQYLETWIIGFVQTTINALPGALNWLIRQFNRIPLIPDIPLIPQWQVDIAGQPAQTPTAPPGANPYGQLSNYQGISRPTGPGAVARGIPGLPSSIQDLVGKYPPYQTPRQALLADIAALELQLKGGAAAAAYGVSPISLEPVRMALDEANRQLAEIAENTEPEGKDAIFAYAPISVAFAGAEGGL